MASRLSLRQTVFPDCLIGDDTGEEFYYFNAVHGIICHRNEDAFSAVKPYLAKTMPGIIFVCNNLAHGLFYQNHLPSSKA